MIRQCTTTVFSAQKSNKWWCRLLWNRVKYFSIKMKIGFKNCVWICWALSCVAVRQKFLFCKTLHFVVVSVCLSRPDTVFLTSQHAAPWHVAAICLARVIYLMFLCWVRQSAENVRLFSVNVCALDVCRSCKVRRRSATDCDWTSENGLVYSPVEPGGYYIYTHRTVVTICTAQRSLYILNSCHYMYCTVVTICTAQWSLYVLHFGQCMYHQFNIQQFHVLPTQLYLCVLCGSQNKQRLFPYTALTDWFL